VVLRQRLAGGTAAADRSRQVVTALQFRFETGRRRTETKFSISPIENNFLPAANRREGKRFDFVRMALALSVQNFYIVTPLLSSHIKLSQSLDDSSLAHLRLARTETVAQADSDRCI